jgi:hypothetical protein
LMRDQRSADDGVGGRSDAKRWLRRSIIRRAQERRGRGTRPHTRPAGALSSGTMVALGHVYANVCSRPAVPPPPSPGSGLPRCKPTHRPSLTSMHVRAERAPPSPSLFLPWTLTQRLYMPTQQPRPRGRYPSRRGRPRLRRPSQRPQGPWKGAAAPPPAAMVCSTEREISAHCGTDEEVT